MPWIWGPGGPGGFLLPYYKPPKTIPSNLLTKSKGTINVKVTIH